MIKLLTAEEMREKTQAQYEKDLELERRLRKEIDVTVTKNLKSIAQELFNSNDSKKLHCYVESFDIDSNAEESLEEVKCKVVKALKQLGYEVTEHIYSKSWCYRSGRYAELTINWR